MINQKNFEQLLINQQMKYPEMQIQDMVKLIYQNEFAGGHLVQNEMECMNRLKAETECFRKYSLENVVGVSFEAIGNNLCRLHFNERVLADKNQKVLNLLLIHRFFMETANSSAGTIQSFEQKLEIFRECCQNNQLPYLLVEVEAYLEEYKKNNYPAVHHSEKYRTAYSPAYRIVRQEYCYYFDLFQKINQLVKTKNQINIAIDGKSGSGKSTLARMLAKIYNCNVFPMDDFFLRAEQRTPERLNEVGGNIDYERFKQEVINQLANEEIKYSPYNCQTQRFDELICVKRKKINVIEGVYSMHPLFADYYDLTVFLSLDQEHQSQRILKRNGPKMYERFRDEWIPMENKYFEVMDIVNQCDLVFEG